MLGLKVSGHNDNIRNMVTNFAWEIDNIGHVPNGNRSYFLSRSQPPFFALMVELLASIDGDAVHLKYLPQLVTEYNFWMDGRESGKNEYRRVVNVHGIYLNRYYDDADEPRAESFYEDVSLMQKTGRKKDLFRNLRAACESGWDFSSRWFNGKSLDSIRTTEIIPVDLNSLLYLLEKSIAKAYLQNNNEEEAKKFESFATARAELMREISFDQEHGFFADNIIPDPFNHSLPTLAMMYPLFAGIATEEQAKVTIRFAEKNLLKDGGWTTTLERSGQQWDAPNGWAPLQWITFVGLKNYGFNELANEGARRWLELNKNVFQRTGRMMEKYNVEDLALEAGGGEYPVQDGFGWTNGVYLALKNKGIKGAKGAKDQLNILK
jgi:alpha,alpha-trehalase